MTSPDDPQAHAANAHSCVIAAAQLWNPLDAKRNEECYRLLTAAMKELEDSRDAARTALIEQPQALRARLAEIQTEAGRLLRLVDASSIFCRGILRSIGAEGREIEAGQTAVRMKTQA